MLCFLYRESTIRPVALRMRLRRLLGVAWPVSRSAPQVEMETVLATRLRDSRRWLTEVMVTEQDESKHTSQDKERTAHPEHWLDPHGVDHDGAERQ